MWPCVAACVLLAAVAADSEILRYGKVGGDIVLSPGTTSGTVTSIIWKHGQDMAVHWDGTDLDRYRQFKEQGSLNTANGELTITGLTRNDSGLYIPEINTMAKSPTRLTVISPVPKPTVRKSCDGEMSSCVLTCDGETTDAAPLTYRWRSGDVMVSSKEQRITKDDSTKANEFICEVENPVSQESSQPIPNPFISTAGGKVNISTGVTVFIGLLIAVLLLVAAHRCKSGMWFFQKASMPWEADFWRKHESSPRDAAESNGTPAQEKGQSDEETPMT